MLPSNVGSNHDLSASGSVVVDDSANQVFNRALLAQPESSTSLQTAVLDGAADSGMGLHGAPAAAGESQVPSEKSI